MYLCLSRLNWRIPLLAPKKAMRSGLGPGLGLMAAVILLCTACVSSACEELHTKRLVVAAAGPTNNSQDNPSSRRRSPLPFIYRVGARRCVFILATGRSGSTSLMDSLNQIPNYLIRGEHWQALGNLYDAYR